MGTAKDDGQEEFLRVSDSKTGKNSNHKASLMSFCPEDGQPKHVAPSCVTMFAESFFIGKASLKKLINLMSFVRSLGRFFRFDQLPQ